MKDTTKALYKALITRHPELENLPLLEAVELLTQAMCAGRKLLLCGNGGGQAAHISTLSLPSPETETYLVQESHLQIYHFLCAAVENELFDC